jgi:hypothetical protein
MRMRSMGHGPRTRWMIFVVPVLAFATTGCMRENEIPDERSLAATIAQQVPDVTVEEVRAEGDGFNYEYSISVHARSNTDDIGAARMLARRVSHVVWHNAEASSRHISVDVDLADCVSEIPCTGAGVDIPTDAARRLWGDAENGDRDAGDSGETFGLTEADGVPDGWQPDFGVEYSPNLSYDVIVPHGTAEPDIRAGVDRIAAALWREHPDRLTGISVNVTSPDTTGEASSRPLVRAYSADELRARFGPRAPDLEQ